MNHHVACTASHLLLGCWCRDGLGGVVKRRLREDITNGMRDGKTVDIKTARGCYDHIDSTLGSEDWAKKHAGFLKGFSVQVRVGHNWRLQSSR